MKIVETYEFDERDLELLRMPLPKNPCEIHCNGGMIGCCGCSEIFEYEKVVEEYKERGIYNIALEIQKVRDNMEKVCELMKEITSLTNESMSIKEKYTDIFENK